MELEAFDRGELLKQLREEKGLSHQQVADRVGGAKNTIIGYEQGKSISMEYLTKLALLYGVTTDYILGMKHNIVIDSEGLTYKQEVLIRNTIKSMVNDLKRLRIFTDENGDDLTK